MLYDGITAREKQPNADQKKILKKRKPAKKLQRSTC
jgi:hypothetical protein